MAGSLFDMNARQPRHKPGTSKGGQWKPKPSAETLETGNSLTLDTHKRGTVTKRKVIKLMGKQRTIKYADGTWYTNSLLDREIVKSFQVGLAGGLTLSQEEGIELTAIVVAKMLNEGTSPENITKPVVEAAHYGIYRFEKRPTSLMSPPVVAFGSAEDEILYQVDAYLKGIDVNSRLGGGKTISKDRKLDWVLKDIGEEAKLPYPGAFLQYETPINWGADNRLPHKLLNTTIGDTGVKLSDLFTTYVHRYHPTTQQQRLFMVMNLYVLGNSLSGTTAHQQAINWLDAFLECKRGGWEHTRNELVEDIIYDAGMEYRANAKGITTSGTSSRILEAILARAEGTTYEKITASMSRLSEQLKTGEDAGPTLQALLQKGFCSLFSEIEKA